jgi:hypothetical protein
VKRFATLIFYVVGLVAVAYLVLYAYVMLTGRDFQPGAPIRIFRKPDAPSYSGVGLIVTSGFCERRRCFFPSPLVERVVSNAVRNRVRGEIPHASTDPSPALADARAPSPTRGEGK